MIGTLVGISLLIAVLSNAAVKFVPKNHAAVVYRMGQMSRVAEERMVIIIPFIESINVVDLNPRNVTAKISDGISQGGYYSAKLSFNFKVYDALRAESQMANIDYASTSLVSSVFKRICLGKTVDALNADQTELKQEVLMELKPALIDAGVEAVSLEIEELKTRV